MSKEEMQIFVHELKQPLNGGDVEAPCPGCGNYVRPTTVCPRCDKLLKLKAELYEE